MKPGLQEPQRCSILETVGSVVLLIFTILNINGKYHGVTTPSSVLFVICLLETVFSTKTAYITDHEIQFKQMGITYKRIDIDRIRSVSVMDWHIWGRIGGRSNSPIVLFLLDDCPQFDRNTHFLGNFIFKNMGKVYNVSFPRSKREAVKEILGTKFTSVKDFD